MRKIYIGMFAACAALILFVPIGFLLEGGLAGIERDAAKIQLAGAKALDSARLRRAARVQAALDSATARHRAAVLKLQASIQRTQPKLDSIVTAAAVERVDTVRVPVEVIKESAATVRACSLEIVTCEERIRAEQESHELTKEDLATANGQLKAALKLIPTTGQKVVHDAKVIALTVGILAAIRSIAGVIR